MIKKRDELEILLHVYSIDILAVTEANFDVTQTEEECKIKGYDMHWEKGREQIRRKNARVVTYVRQGLDVKVENKLMEEDLVPEVWLSVGEPGRKRFLIGAIYREHNHGSRKELETGKEKPLQSKLKDGGDGWRERLGFLREIKKLCC